MTPRCVLGEYLEKQLHIAARKGEILEQARLTRDLMEHEDKCAVCRGLLPQPQVPLADQLFGTHVHIGKDVSK